MSVLFYDHNGVVNSADSRRLPRTRELCRLHEALSSRGDDAKTITLPQEVPTDGKTLLVVHPPGGLVGPFSVPSLIQLARDRRDLYVLLVSSAASSLGGLGPMPDNMRTCSISYHEITVDSVADVARQIRDGKGWDETSPLLRPPLLNGCLALYLLFIAGRNPTLDSHGDLFNSAANELEALHFDFDADNITRDHLHAALQASFS